MGGQRKEEGQAFRLSRCSFVYGSPARFDSRPDDSTRLRHLRQRWVQGGQRERRRRRARAVRTSRQKKSGVRNAEHDQRSRLGLTEPRNRGTLTCKETRAEGRLNAPQHAQVNTVVEEKSGGRTGALTQRCVRVPRWRWRCTPQRWRGLATWRRTRARSS